MRLWILLLCLGLLACPAGREDDDDVADDDDSASADDDDDSVSADDDDSMACSVPAPPYALDVSGATAASIEFDNMLCTPYGGDYWAITFRTADDSWSLRLATGVLVEGEQTVDGNSVSLRKPTEQLEFTSAQTTAVVTIEVEAYGDSPCGSFTVGALGDNAGGTVEIGPQPVPFRCP